jgi:hypothetical protein
VNRSSFIPLLTSHWLGMCGVALATTAGFSWLFVLPMHLQGENTNPYIGLLVVFAIPLLLLAGLALIPIGIARARRRQDAGTLELPNHGVAWRKLGIFFGLISFVNVVIGSQATYRAVKYMETENFCGATCHVMKPEFTAWKHATHSSVECVSCHIAPGAGGFVKAKMAGTQQLMDVIFNSYPRPIKSGIESQKLVKSADTCENCHARNRDWGTPVRIRHGFKSDEANTPTATVMVMLVRGGASGGIHGAHLSKGVKIRFVATDAKRQNIPWVEMTDASGRVTAYQSPGVKPEDIAKMPKIEMQCVDCHNRPAHSFELPERALDRAMAEGRLPADLPYLRKEGSVLLNAADSPGIGAALDRFYRQSYPDVYSKRRDEIAKAGAALAGIHEQNVFSDLKVAWGTYPNNLGHMDTPGCFRCHDGDHTSPDKRIIPNDCATCHQLPALDETSPAVLKSLGFESGSD